MQGIVPVGLCPALPLDGIAMILGNDLAGSAVWADGPPSPVVSPKPYALEKSQSNLGSSVFPACAVTRAQSCATVLEDKGVVVPPVHVSLSSLPQAISCQEWGRSQRADSTLSSLWAEVLPSEKIRDVALGYFVQGDLLVRKWVPCEGDFVGKAVYQVVVPAEFCDVVLKMAHDGCDTWGYEKPMIEFCNISFGSV